MDNDEEEMDKSTLLNQRFGAWARKVVRDEPFAALSFLVALLAFFTGAGGLYTSREALNQSRQQFLEDRALVLVGTFGENTAQLKVSPADPSFRFMQGAVRFPTVLLDKPQPIEESGNVWGMGTLDFKLNKYMIEKFPPKTGIGKFIQADIPIMIQSYYAIKGQAYTDTSLYYLRYNGTIVETNPGPLNPKFVGLAFIHRFNSDELVPEHFLEEIMEKGMMDEAK
jgi:hypothetical protein